MKPGTRGDLGQVKDSSGPGNWGHLEKELLTPPKKDCGRQGSLLEESCCEVESGSMDGSELSEG